MQTIEEQVSKPPIFLFSSSLSRSGGARQAAYLARGLGGSGWEVRFFAPEGSQVPELDPELGWVELPADPSRWRAEVERHLPQEGRFIFQAFHNKAVKKLSLWGLSWRRRGGLCFGYRGLMRRPGNPLPYWSPGIKGFIVNSEACARVLAGIGVSRRRLYVVPNAVPEERTRAERPKEQVLAELGLTGRETIIGTVSGSKPEKGTSELLAAFSRVDRDQARLVLVGNPRRRWEHELSGIADRVVFVERTEQVGDYLQVLDAFILPSLSESMPNTLLEAVRAGLPVLASRVGGVPEVAEGHGLLFDPGDVSAMAEAMRRIIDDPKLREGCAAASVAQGPEFSLEARTARMESIYLDALGRG
jgi:glycosyltransferase involved in cell wall biosynthesis